MRAPMQKLFVVAVIMLGSALGACGKEIGDECIAASDCSSDGSRTCDNSQKGGYCTIMGCDYSTCPDEAVCVRFFTGSFANKPCNSMTEDLFDKNGNPDPMATDDCSLDELCTLGGHCASRSSEIRYCMKKCGEDGDCRDGYDCRNFDEMKTNGGEPVLEPPNRVDEHAPNFCAISPN
jgi:hypothetical protein